jgi:hypothetical protein
MVLIENNNKGNTEYKWGEKDFGGGGGDSKVNNKNFP